MKTIHETIEKTLVIVEGVELHYMHTIGLRDGVSQCISGLKGVIPATAIALTPAANFDEIAVKMGYQKADPDKVQVSKGVVETLSLLFDDAARRSGGSKAMNPDYIVGVFVSNPRCREIAAELTAALEVHHG